MNRISDFEGTERPQVPVATVGVDYRFTVRDGELVEATKELVFRGPMQVYINGEYVGETMELRTVPKSILRLTAK